MSALSFRAPGLGPRRRVVVREERVYLEEAAGEAWAVLFEAAFEVPSWRTRELARLLVPGGPVPVRPLRDGEGVRRLLEQLLGPVEESRDG